MSTNKNKKKCSKCNRTKILAAFSKDKTRKDGVQATCKTCVKQYRQENAEKIAEYYKQYHQENAEKLAKYSKQYSQENAEKLAEYKKQYTRTRLKTDPLFKLVCNVRSLIRGSFKRNKTKNFKKQTKTEQLLGCTIEQFQEHLAKQFKKGMSLDNHGEWHIDHIIPLASASTQAEIEALCHYTNLQPLWADDNLKKGAKA